MSPRFFTPALLLRKSDAELAALVTAGHEAAFTAIVLRHRAHLLRHCRGVLRDQRAEDAVQQTFVRALQALRSGTDVRELRPWLYRIAHNVALSELAAGKRDHAELNEEWEDDSRSGECDRRATLREALLAVEALPDRQRAALLRSAAGDPPAAIARELGVTTVAARQLVHRARLSVRAAVRVVCPPPLIWLARRATVTWERVPRAAGVPAGAAPVASKIAIAVVASATVAAPATVLHSVLTHRAHPSRHVRVIASRSVPAVALAPRAEAPANQPAAAPPAPASPAPAARAPRAPSAPKATPPAATSSDRGPGVSASSPGSAPVGNSSSSADPSAGAPIAGAASASGASGSAYSGVGPTSTDSASSPTQSSASGTDSTGSASASSSGTSTDASGTGAGTTATSP